MKTFKKKYNDEICDLCVNNKCLNKRTPNLNNKYEITITLEIIEDVEVRIVYTCTGWKKPKE